MVKLRFDIHDYPPGASNREMEFSGILTQIRLLGVLEGYDNRLILLMGRKGMC